MKFKNYHNIFFRSASGAFSAVTEREFYDSQITLTDVETEVVLNHFGRGNIHVGPVNRNPEKAKKIFKLYNTGQIIGLNLIFPKPNNSELRLYLSTRAGFKPEAGSVWFIFEDSERILNIGHLDRQSWFNLGQIDLDDESYSQSLAEATDSTIQVDRLPDSSKISTSKTKGGTKYRRNPNVALKRIILADYSCEIDSKHTTFTWAKSGNQFMEAHHLIPMAFQGLFKRSLDNVDNIVSLCPNCHRAFHLSIPEEKKELIAQIYDQRAFVKEILSKDEAFGLYNCYDI